MLQEEEELRKMRKRDRVSGRRMMPMPLKPKAKERKYGYDQNYLKQNITIVGVTFNKRKKDDQMILDWLNSRAESRVAYIKRLILEDIEASGK